VRRHFGAGRDFEQQLVAGTAGRADGDLLAGVGAVNVKHAVYDGRCEQPPGLQRLDAGHGRGQNG
jgi:hypothetical protein